MAHLALIQAGGFDASQMAGSSLAALSEQKLDLIAQMRSVPFQVLVNKIQIQSKDERSSERKCFTHTERAVVSESGGGSTGYVISPFL